MDDAIELACRMEQDKSIPSEAALIVRSQAAVRTLLFEKTHNNPVLITEDTIKNVIADYVTRESREEAEAAVAKAVDANTAKLKKEHSIEIEKVIRERDDAYSENRQRAIEMRNDAEQIANRWAAIAKKGMEYLVLVVWLALLAGSVYCLSLIHISGSAPEFVRKATANQAVRPGPSARIRFANASRIFTFAVCFCKPRYCVFRYRSWSFKTAKTCSTLARTEDFSCSRRLICA